MYVCMYVCMYEVIKRSSHHLRVGVSGVFVGVDPPPPPPPPLFYMIVSVCFCFSGGNSGLATWRMWWCSWIYIYIYTSVAYHPAV